MSGGGWLSTGLNRSWVSIVKLHTGHLYNLHVANNIVVGIAKLEIKQREEDVRSRVKLDEGSASNHHFVVAQ